MKEFKRLIPFPKQGFNPPKLIRTAPMNVSNIKFLYETDFKQMDDIYDLYYELLGYDCRTNYNYKHDLLRLLGNRGMSLLLSNRKLSMNGFTIQLDGSELNEISVRGEGSDYKKGKSYLIYDNSSDTSDYFKILERFNKAGLKIKRLTTPQKDSQQLIMVRNANLLPSMKYDIPEEASLMYWQAIKGGMMVAIKLGYFPKVYDYDVNGSYGYELSKMPNLSSEFCTWKEWKSSNKLDMIWDDDILGVYEFDAYIPPWFLGPIGVRSRDNRVYFPVDIVIKNYTGTKETIERVLSSGGKVKIRKGWNCRVNKWIYPYRKIIKAFSKLKKYPETRQYAKMMITTSYGKTMGSYGDGIVSPMFCPAIGATVTERNISKVFNLARMVSSSVLAVPVDGLLLSKDLPKEIKDSVVGDELGEFRLDAVGTALCGTDHHREIEGKEHGDWEFGKRGVITHRRSNLFKDKPINTPYGSNGRRVKEEYITLKDIKTCQIPSFALNSKDMDKILSEDYNLLRSAVVPTMLLNKKVDKYYESL